MSRYKLKKFTNIYFQEESYQETLSEEHATLPGEFVAFVCLNEWPPLWLRLHWEWAAEERLLQ